MEINCNDIPIGISYNTNQLYKLKSGKLVRELININNDMCVKRNFMVMSMNVFNILENHDNFEHRNLLGNRYTTGLYLVGHIIGIDCYVDLSMMEDTIILSFDISLSRDIKLESVLNGTKLQKEEVRINVII